MKLNIFTFLIAVVPISLCGLESRPVVDRMANYEQSVHALRTLMIMPVYEVLLAGLQVWSEQVRAEGNAPAAEPDLRDSTLSAAMRARNMALGRR